MAGQNFISKQIILYRAFLEANEPLWSQNEFIIVLFYFCFVDYFRPTPTVLRGEGFNIFFVDFSRLK